MLISNKNEIINNKEVPIRITGNAQSKYIYLLNHGLLSKKESFTPFEKWANDKYLSVSFDARGNEGSLLAPSKFGYKYVNDIRNVVIWLKKKYPNKKIVVVGSSWGAAVVIKFAKRYGQLVHRVISWSIPHKTFSSNAALATLEDATTTSNKDVSNKWWIGWAFFWMLTLNINTKIKLKIDYEKTAHNKMLARLGKMKTFNIVSTRYIWSAWRILISAIKSIKYLNKKSKVKILYIQSSNDSYGYDRTYKFLDKNTGKQVEYLLIDEFFHALHWEVTNNFNIRMFDAVTNWVESGKVKFVGPAKVATQTNRKLNFSFIVPIYNVKQYLNKCIKSILQNKTNDYELILVNDKSTDGSDKILSKYAKYKNVKIINHKNNKGLSAARNTGLKNAKGEWYIFVDSDDYISPDFTLYMKNHLNNIHNLYVYKIIKDNKAHKIDSHVQKYKANDSLVSRVVNNSLFDDYRFPEKYRYAIEDWDFYVNKLDDMKIKDICRDPKIWYYYTYNPVSLSKAKKVYRSRLLHAIDIYNNPKTRKNALSYKMYGHYYMELLIMSAVWFPDLNNEVKKIKYKQKIRITTRIQYFIIKIWFIKKMIRKLRSAIDE